jgi:hypothetical protein
MKQTSVFHKPLPLTTVFSVIFLFITLIIAIVYTITKSNYDTRSKAFEESICMAGSSPDAADGQSKCKGQNSLKGYSIVKTYKGDVTTDQSNACTALSNDAKDCWVMNLCDFSRSNSTDDPTMCPLGCVCKKIVTE